MNNRFSPNKCRAMTAVMACGLLLASMWAEAAGLGGVTVHSQLGQPLRAEIRVSATSDELAGMVAHLAAQDAYAQSGVRSSPTVRQLRFNLEKSAGGAVIKVTSEKPINDPFVGFMLELSWPAGRLTREYTFLIDPPKDLPAGSSDVAATPPPPKAGELVRPAAPTSAPAGTTAAVAGEHVVKPGETLYRIATENLPAGATLEQTQVALYRANPAAFDGSITRLRAGAVLKIPTQADVTAISQSEAQEALKGTRASAASSAPRVPARAQATKSTGPTEAELAARKKAVSEFNARVNNMQQEVGKLQQQVESKNEQLARIEKEKAEKKAALEAAAAAAAQAEVKPPETVAPVAPPAPPVPPDAEETVAEPDVADVTPDVTPSLDEETQSDEQSEESETVTIEPPEPPPVPVQQPARAPVQLDVQEPEESGLPLGWILGGVGALVVLVLGFLFLRRRGNSDDDGDTLAASTETAPSIGPYSEGFSTKGPASVFQIAGGQSVDTSNTTAPPVSEFSQAAPGAVDTDEVDPVAEADVYMAYGRDGQAEEILLDALHKNPKRIAIPLKLLEVYASRKSVKDFETLATELYAQTGGKGAEWEKVLALGSSLDPSNPLYSGSGGAAATPSHFESEADIALLLGEDAEAPEFDPLTTDAATRSAPTEFDLLASDAIAKPTPSPAQQSPQPVAQPDLTKSGAFSFSLDSNPVPPPAAAPVATAAAPAADDPLLSMLQEESATGAEEDDPLLSLLHEESITGAESDLELLEGGETEVSPSTPENKSAPLGFDFEEKPPVPTREPAPVPKPAASATPEPSTISQAILDFDLGGDSIAPTSEHYDEPEDDIAATVVNPDAILLDSGAKTEQAAGGVATGNIVDFELEVPEAVSPYVAHQDEMSSDEMAATSIVSIEPDDDMEFDVQLTESTILGNPGGGAGFDLSGISLDLGTNAAPASATPAAAEPDLAEALNEEALSDEGGAVSDPRRDEVNTKLDLAKAYEEMGDLEGARELLGEVVSEGAPDQVAEAQTMLTRLNV